MRNTVSVDMLASRPALAEIASNTALRMPTRPSTMLRPRLAASCAKSGPITTPRLGDGGGEARTCAAQALAAALSSCDIRVRKPAASIASRVADAVSRKLVAGVRAQVAG